MENDKATQLFYGLIYTFQMQAMFQMGKLKNPMTDKIEKDLQSAMVSIDMLEMLMEKTKNNISDEEKKFLEHTLSDLKLNYVDESNKEQSKETPAEEKKE
jgi:hypothetical protein